MENATQIRVNGNPQTAGGAPVLFETALTTGWQNFGDSMDFDKK